MSYCKEEGKDQVMFATKEDMNKPSEAIINLEEKEEEKEPGLLLPNGDINWACPCLGGMATGPCGVDFREAFGCFHYSEADPKGSDCYEKFMEMQECMTNHPEVYPAADKQLEDSLDQLDGESSKDDNKLSEVSSELEVKS